MTKMDDIPGDQRVVLVTGPSGAGRATAINALEDFGFEAIDNIPLTLVPRLVESSGRLDRPLAVGIDTRNRDFSVNGLLRLHETLRSLDGVNAELLYLDCSAEVLERRYSETRRRHPMAPDETPRDGILREFALLQDVLPRADVVIDTSRLTARELRAEMGRWFETRQGQRIAVSLHSFSYKRGLPQGLDMALDCRFLRNPHWDPALRPLTGLDAAVVRHIEEDPRFRPYLDRLVDLVAFLLPEAEAEGKAHLAIGLGCTGGRHRSVAMAEAVARALSEKDWRLSVRHRELERRNLATPDAFDPPALGEIRT